MGAPAITDEARREVSRFLDDPIYRIKLLRRFRNGEGGALEVWFWRWKLGDPKPARAATDESDRAHFNELRAAVQALIKNRDSDEHAVLEAEILGELPPRRIEAGDIEEDEPDEPAPRARRAFRAEVE